MLLDEEINSSRSSKKDMYISSEVFVEALSEAIH